MQRLCSANQRDERSVHGAVKTPPRRSQSSSVGRQEAPSQALWYIAPSRPRPKMSSRLLPHAVTAGGLLKTTCWLSGGAHGLSPVPPAHGSRLPVMAREVPSLPYT